MGAFRIGAYYHISYIIELLKDLHEENRYYWGGTYWIGNGELAIQIR